MWIKCIYCGCNVNTVGSMVIKCSICKCSWRTTSFEAMAELSKVEAVFHCCPTCNKPLLRCGCGKPIVITRNNVIAFWPREIELLGISYRVKCTNCNDNVEPLIGEGKWNVGDGTTREGLGVMCPKCRKGEGNLIGEFPVNIVKEKYDTIMKKVRFDVDELYRLFPRLSARDMSKLILTEITPTVREFKESIREFESNKKGNISVRGTKAFESNLAKEPCTLGDKIKRVFSSLFLKSLLKR